jgi:hypothetical protein
MASDETTNTGRFPACSRPLTGSSETKYISPRLIIVQTVDFEFPELALDHVALVSDLRVCCHFGHGALKGTGSLFSSELTKRDGYQSIEVVAKGRRRGSSNLVDDLPGKRDATANDCTRLSGTAHITPMVIPYITPDLIRGAV